MIGEHPQEDTECWPENWESVCIFCALGTQWNVAYGGFVGLKYEALPTVYETFGTKKKKRAAIFESLRILENEALSVINER